MQDKLKGIFYQKLQFFLRGLKQIFYLKKKNLLPIFDAKWSEIYFHDSLN